MAQFVWEGKKRNGKIVEGVIEAKDIQSVYNLLKSQGITPDPQTIKEKGKGMEMELHVPGFAPKVQGKDVVIFTRQLATMIDAGLPLVQALSILSKGSDKPVFAKTLDAVKAKVETGDTLSLIHI